MIPNPTSETLTILLFGVSALIFIMLLPALLELKKPKDAGPRLIMGDARIPWYFQKGEIIPLPSIEEEKTGLDQAIINKIADVIAFLPNLET